MGYGVASGPNVEEGNVCGWSPMQNKCGVVAIEEEGPSYDSCMYRITKATCAGFSSTASHEYVCAWDPFRNVCRGGQLQKEEEPEGPQQNVHGVNIAPLADMFS